MTAARWIAVFSLSLLGLLASGCGSPERPRLEFKDFPIMGGQADTDPAHYSVVAMTFGGYMCSGTLIAPRVVMTAGHCAGSSVGSYTIYFGSTAQSTTRRSVVEKWVHPQYDEQNIRYDIALLRLSSDEPSSAVPIPYLPHSLAITQTDITNQTPLDFVGFGMTDPNDDYSAGTKMIYSDHLNWVCTSGYGCSWPNPATSKNICMDETPGGLCEGDSGGPAIVNRSGTDYVAGVSSYVGQGCQDFACSTKVDEYEQEIEDFIGSGLGTTCSSAVACDSGYCVDGVCCESSCSGECRACDLSGHRGECLQVPNGTQCPDGNRCNGTETCQNGVCSAGQALDCHNSNVCTGETCDPAQGCLYNHLPDGTPCSNGDACDGEELCSNGVCSPGTAMDCDDRNPCTDDSCEGGGCQHTAVADDTSCGGGLCGEQYCTAGKCVSSNTQDCDDQNECTRDWCDPASGCVHESLPQGYACGECLMCLEQQCVEAPDCSTVSGCGCSASSGGRQHAMVLAFLLLLGLAVRRAR
jgi:MYXO-CTERM domain-containing protein